MKQIYSILRYIVLFPVAILITYFLLPFLERFYRLSIDTGGGFDIDFTQAGIALFTLFASFTLLLVMAGEKIRYRNQILILIILMLLFSISLDPAHLYFPAGLIVAGVGLGFTLRLMISKTIGATAQGEALKKYF